MKNIIKLFVLILSVSASTAAYAVDDSRFEFGIHTDMANIKANELVYSGSYKVSELTWDTKRAFMVGGDLSVLMVPSWGLKLNTSVSTTVNKSDSVMDDYDWLMVGADWTDWSHHNNTKLEKGLIFDANLSARLYENSDSTFKLDMLLGYRRDQWRWQAVGGTFIYSTFFFRDTVGSFANIPVITYEQTLDTPYIGAAFEVEEDNFILGVKVIGSAYVSAKGVDHHHLRSLVFTDTFSQGNMIGGDINLDYRLSENAKVGVYYSFQDYSHNRGDTVIYNQVTTASTFIPNDAGMKLSYYKLGINASYAF